MKLLIFNSLLLILFITSKACNQSKIEQVSFLIGTWKIEGKNSYESWETMNNSIIGKAYKIKDNKELVNENLQINLISEKLIYTATVLNQNNGKGIDFTLNETIKNKLSFENLNHDFPKKIQYTKLSDSVLFVEVLGKNDKGFSYKIMKQN